MGAVVFWIILGAACGRMENLAKNDEDSPTIESESLDSPDPRIAKNTPSS
tara:strand:+ start:3092 stop:3241 length:150 start_codon:yes stop_codon:yes gene_type:complete